MTNQLKLAIVIVEFNSSSDTLNCLVSLDKNLGKGGCKVYISDNSSSISTEVKARLGDFSFDYEYFWNGGNLGFSKACNLGLAKARIDGFDFAMLLNNDTVLIDDSALKAVSMIKESPDFGVLGLINYFYDDPERIWQSGKVLRSSKLGFRSVEKSLLSGITECDYVPGSSFLIRLSLLDSIGNLDEDLFAYYEEIDFCFRVKRHGYKVGYVNDSRILHKVGASSDSKIRSYLKVRNKLVFYKRIIPNPLKFLFVGTSLVLKDLAIAVSSRKKWNNIYSIILGVYDSQKGNMGLSRFSFPSNK